MYQTNLLINSNQLIHWFNALRNLPDNDRARALDAFWAGQLDSKCWLVNTLNDYVSNPSNIYVFGGWIGVLSSMLFQCSKFEVKNIRSIDLDPWCESIADTVCQPYMIAGSFKAITSDMKEFNYDWDIYPNVVINTSTEHIDQETYDIWYDKIPSGSLVVLQGNNFFDCPEHVRCSKSLIEFKRMNYATSVLWSGELIHDLYTRYMAILKK
jgi:hypothetical protein